LPEGTVVNDEMGVSVLFSTAPTRGLKPHVVEAPVSMEVCSVLGSHLPLGGGVNLTVALSRLATDFLVKLRVEMDQVICFGLGFKLKTTRELRKRMGWVSSRLGLKPKHHFGFNLRGRRRGLLRRPGPLGEGSCLPVSVSEKTPGVSEASSEMTPSCLALSSDVEGVEGVSGSISEKMPEAFLGVSGKSEAAESESPARGLLGVSGDAVFLGHAVGSNAADFAPPTDSIRTSPIVRSTNLAALEVNAVGSNAADFAPPTDSIRTSPIVRSTNLAALEFAGDD
jgi:hypothetical protein